MQASLVSVLLGKSVVDTYGRQVGVLLGYSVDQSGEISTIAVDRGTEGFKEFEADRFTFEKETITITPRWEAECQEMSEDMGDVQERLAFLKQLAKQMGIPKSKVDQLIKKSDGKLYAFLQSYKLLAERMALRGFEIESQIEDLDDFVASLSAQRNAGSIDDATYDAIVENCRALRTKNLREVEDLSDASKALRISGHGKVMGRLGEADEEPEPASTQGRAGAKRSQLIAEMP